MAKIKQTKAAMARTIEGLKAERTVMLHLRNHVAAWLEHIQDPAILAGSLREEPVEDAPQLECPRCHTMVPCAMPVYVDKGKDGKGQEVQSIGLCGCGHILFLRSCE